MRILIIAPPWVPVPPPAYGGTEAVLDTLARGLVAGGHHVVLYTTGDSRCPVQREWVFETARGVGIDGLATELRHVIAAYEAAEDFDVVHDHTLAGPIYADRFPWIPVVTTNHGPFKRELLPLYRAIGERSPVIAISHHQASTAIGVSLAGVVHHGLDVSRVPLGSGRGGYAMFLGRMHPDKGVHTAARAARAAGIPLKIAARMCAGEEIRYFEECVSPLLGGDIEYIGEVGRDEKFQLLGEARCLVNPIAWPEPFGMVMIEALASGTPVVTTNAGAAPEIVDDGLTGYLVDDEPGLVMALQRAADINRQACRGVVEDRFSGERMVAEHLTIYRCIIDAKRQALIGNARAAVAPSRSSSSARSAQLLVSPASAKRSHLQPAGTAPVTLPS